MCLFARSLMILKIYKPVVNFSHPKSHGNNAKLAVPHIFNLIVSFNHLLFPPSATTLDIQPFQQPNSMTIISSFSPRKGGSLV